MPPTEHRKAYIREYSERTHRVSVTLSESEYRELAKRAKGEGVRVTTLVKNMALAYHQGQIIMPEGIAEELKEFRFLVRNIASNVNQMAHHSNTIGRMVDENAFLGEIRKLEEAVATFTENRLNPRKTATK